MSNLRKLVDQSEHKSLEFKAQDILAGLFHGRQKSAFHGYSAEFKTYKSYNPGENLNNIDWKLFGRTDKLFIKQFNDERNLKAYFLLDLSSSMFFPVETNQKIQRAIEIIAVICSILQKQKDHFSLIIIAENVIFETPVLGNLNHLKNIYEKLESSLQNIQGNHKTHFVKEFNKLIPKIGTQKIVFVISDFMFEPTENSIFKNTILELKSAKNEIQLLYLFDQSEIAMDTTEESIVSIRDVESGELTSLDYAQLNTDLSFAQKTKWESLFNPMLARGIKVHALEVGLPLPYLIKKII